MDFSISNWIFQTFGNSKAFAVAAKIITILGEWWFVVLAAAILIVFKRTRKIGMFVAVACLLTLCLNNYCLKLIVKRNRPFVDNKEWVKLCELAGYILPTGYSMASGHASASMAFAVMLFMFSKKWGSVAIGTSVLIGLSRLCLCVHYFTDVLVGWSIGAAVAVLTYFLMKKVVKYIKNRGNNNEKNYISDKKSA